MDVLTKTILAIDKHFHDPNDAQEFSERLFFNIGRLYTYGMLSGAITGVGHRRNASSRASHLLDNIADHAWRSSITFAKAALIYTPLEVSIRKNTRVCAPLSNHLAWGCAWAAAPRSLSWRQRLTLGVVTGSGHHVLHEFGPAIAESLSDGAQLARYFNTRMRAMDGVINAGKRAFSRSTKKEEPSVSHPEELAESLTPKPSSSIFRFKKD